MEGTVTISIKDFEMLKRQGELKEKIVKEIEECSEIEKLGKGAEQKVFQKVNTKKVEKLLKEYAQTDDTYVDYIAWNEQVSLYFEDTEGSIEKSLLEGYRHEQLAEIMETIEKLDDLNYADRTLEQLTDGKVKCIDELLYELQEELGCITEE